MAVHNLIERVQVLSVDPDDVFLIKLERELEPDEMESFAAAWRTAMPGHRVVIYYGAEFDVEILREVERPMGHHQPGECDECDAIRAMLDERDP